MIIQIIGNEQHFNVVHHGNGLCQVEISSAYEVVFFGWILTFSINWRVTWQLEIWCRWFFNLKNLTRKNIYMPRKTLNCAQISRIFFCLIHNAIKTPVNIFLAHTIVATCCLLLWSRTNALLSSESLPATHISL